MVINNQTRLDHEPPPAIGQWDWRYHHTGIPTTIRLPNEQYLPAFKLYKSGFEVSPFGIEWMRFEPDSPVHELIKTVAHVAFEVDDLDEELKKHALKLLTPPNPPSDGVRVAMIEHNGAPIELIEFTKKG